MMQSFLMGGVFFLKTFMAKRVVNPANYYYQKSLFVKMDNVTFANDFSFTFLFAKSLFT